MRKHYQVYQIRRTFVKGAVALLTVSWLLACGAEDCKKSEEGHKRCDDTTLQECKDGTWDDTDCLEDACTGYSAASCVEDSKTEAHCDCK